MRAEFGADIPFVLGELSRTRSNSVNFNNNLPNLAASAPGISFVSSEGITAPASDTTHFDADGQIELGQRYAAEFGTLAPEPEPEPTGEPVVFDFFETDGDGVAGADPAGTDFDPSAANDTVTVDGLTLTVVDVTAREYDVSGDLPVATGNILSSADDDNVVTNISGQRALGINNPSISNGNFDLIGDGNDSADFNPGETLTFTFDQAVQFTSIELESVIAEDSFDVLVDGVAVLETTGDDSFIDDLGGLTGLTIAAGSEITFAVDGILAPDLTDLPSTSIRIETFTVEIVGSTLLGDVNLDGTVNFLDISPFIAVLSGGIDQAEADCNEDGEVNFLDISPFISILSGS